MRKLYTLLLVLFTVSFTTVVNGQELNLTQDAKRPQRSTAIKPAAIPVAGSFTPLAAPKKERCGFAYQMQKAKAKGFSESSFEAEVSRLIQKRIAEGERFTGPVTLPVIFHVVYRTADALGNSSANLNTAKYQDQINQLNIDYANLAGSTWAAASDVQIRFCMAVVDTAGRPLPTAGIDRINAQTKGWLDTDPMDIATLTDYFDTLIKPKTIWDPYSYLNVWTASMTTSGLLGYSTFPGFSTLSGLDNLETLSTAGSVVTWEGIGSVASPGFGAPYNFGRTLTHELGHFFGLRHIWGDAVCGDDYCADTPPQDAATTGCPAVGTLNNCIPSGPKMFPNYMDYSNDACLNTFTANQATRCQTVMDNTPRRIGLISSKACAARPGNSIGFSTAVPYAVSEAGPTGACPNSRSYSFNVYVSTQASAAATVNFTLGGTATLNKDYTISPASVSYTTNDNAVKTVTITVIDDQAVESTEDIVLGYTITGSGVVAGPDKQAISLSIIDNDIANITVDNTTPTKTLLTENFNASANIPAGWTTEVYGDGVTTPNQWVVGANGGTGTTGNAAYVTSNTTTKPNTYNVNNLSDAYLFSPLIDATGLKNLLMNFKWKCNGENGYDGGFLGYIPFGQAVTAANVQFFNIYLTGQTTILNSSLSLGSGFSGTKFYFVYNWYNDNSVGTNPPFTIDDVSFTGKAFSIASAVDADTSYSQYNSQNAQYYSVNAASPFDNRIIATVNNLNSDIGCIGANVQAAGTGQTAVTTTSGSFFRSDKVIQLTPAAANSTATYQVTLYYTTAELAIWGANVPLLKILKVKDGVSLASTLNNTNAAVFATTVDDQRATKGYVSFTANVTGGFSQFMLTSPTTVIPVTLTDFEAKGNVKNILLNWSTTTEQNNKGFAIERSSDGLNFEKIGWVNGKVNSNQLIFYTYTDNFVQANIVYYYRLRQTDLDNREKLSAIRQAKIKSSNIEVSISPNPATDQLKLFVSGTSGLTDVNLINAEGQIVRTWKQINTTSAAATLDIRNLATGIYMLQVVMPQSTKVEKLIIK